MAKTITSGQHAWIVADKLKVDPSFQRPLNTQKVSKIANEFDPDAIGVIYVSKRSNGEMVILDGQNRIAAVRRIGWGDQKVPCHVFVGLTVEQEARLFVEFNDLRTRPKPIEIHKAKVVAGDIISVGIDRILDKHGLHFASGPSNGAVVAVGAVRHAYERGGPEALDFALDTIVRTWGFATENFTAELIRALTLLSVRYGDELEQDRLIKVLAKTPPTHVTQRAKLLRAEFGGELTSVVAQIILKLYNFRNPRHLAWEDRSAKNYWTPQHGA